MVSEQSEGQGELTFSRIGSGAAANDSDEGTGEV